MKKVLLSAYACIPNHGSEEGNGWNYATLLSANGFEIHCLTQDRGREAIKSILDEGYFPNLTFHYVTVPQWVEKSYGSLIGLYIHYLYWQWNAYKLGRQLDQQYQFDLVHHVTYASIQLGSFLYKLRKPFIFGPVGGGQRAPKAFKRYFGSYWSREWMRDWVSVLFQYINPGYLPNLKKANRVLVSNQDTLALAKLGRPSQPIDRMLDAGLSASFLPAKVIERTPGPALKLLWTGRLMPRKALEMTIEAFGKVPSHLPITLTIVGGKGEMADQVPHYIEKYSVKDRVHWAGHVSYQEVKEFYEQSDVFFFTSLRDSCPMQLMEAMAYSLPVVTLDLHGQAELVDGTNGIKVPAIDPEQATTDLAKAIEWMYAHPAERIQMGKDAYEFAKSQVWEHKIKRFVDDIYPATLAQNTVGYKKENNLL